MEIKIYRNKSLTWVAIMVALFFVFMCFYVKDINIFILSFSFLLIFYSLFYSLKSFKLNRIPILTFNDKGIKIVELF